MKLCHRQVRFVRQALEFFAFPWVILAHPTEGRQWHGVRAAVFSAVLVATAALPVAISSGWIESGVFWFVDGRTARPEDYVTPLFGEAVLKWWLWMVAPYPIWLGLMYFLQRVVVRGHATLHSGALSVSARFGLGYLLAYALPVGGAWVAVWAIVGFYRALRPAMDFLRVDTVWVAWTALLVIAGLSVVGLALWRHARYARVGR